MPGCGEKGRPRLLSLCAGLLQLARTEHQGAPALHGEASQVVEGRLARIGAYPTNPVIQLGSTKFHTQLDARLMLGGKDRAPATLAHPFWA